MGTLKLGLYLSTVIIFAVTFGAVVNSGINWPGWLLSDIAAVNWRSQFNTDLVIHLVLLGRWVHWREGGGLKGMILGIFCLIWGGMFTFPYLLYAIAQARGDMTQLFLGVNASRVHATP